MKLYDVIRKEDMENGKILPEPQERRDEYRPVPTKKNIFRKLIIFGISVIFLVALYVIGMKVAHAKVVINERHIPFSLDGMEIELVHEKEASTGRLSFQTMVVSSSVTRQVYGSDVLPSNSTAKGKVVIFNEYSKSAQKVAAKTTLTGANGKKYITQTAVTVPGYTTSGTKKLAGTSVSVAVTAADVGPTYNTTGTSFTIAGWGGTRAKLFYAQSAGAIAGGEDGSKHIVSEDEKDDVVATLNSQLIEKLKRETRAQIPEDLIAYTDLQLATVDSESLVLRGSSIKFPASLAGSMVTYLIPRDLLESTIATKVLNERNYANVAIPTISDLTVTPITALPTDPNSIPESIKIKLSGQGTIITKAPVATIKQTLLGQSKGNFDEILSAIPEVDTAKYHFYPFWAPYFPSDENRITIDIK